MSACLPQTSDQAGARARRTEAESLPSNLRSGISSQSICAKGKSGSTARAQGDGIARRHESYCPYVPLKNLHQITGAQFEGIWAILLAHALTKN